MQFGKTQLSDVVPAVDTNIYSSGDCVGGLNTIRLPNHCARGVLKSVVVIDVDDQKAALTLLFFSAQPAGTFTNNAAAGLSAADAKLVVGKVDVAAADYTSVNGGRAVAKVDCSEVIQGVDGTRELYLLAVSNGATPTYTTVASLKFRVGILPD